MQKFIVVLLFLIVAVASQGFEVEYKKFDDTIKNFRQPNIQQHIANLQRAIPIRLKIDLDELATKGPDSAPNDCVDDSGRVVYCQYDQIGENVVSAYVDAIVKLPFTQYPYNADNMQMDPNNPDGDKRQDMYTNYAMATDLAIQTAVNQSFCELISNGVDAVGYTTKFGYTVGITCPDDRTYRTKLATNPNFYNNVVAAKLGRTLRLGPNLATNIDVDLSKASKSEDLADYRKKMEQAYENARNVAEIDAENEVEERQSVSPVTGYDYTHPACGGVWYKDYLDGNVNGQCIGQTCEYIGNRGAGTDFYLLDSGVQITHPEFNGARLAGRLKSLIALNKTECRFVMHEALGVHYAGSLTAPAPPPVVPPHFRPFHDVSPFVGTTKLPISKYTGYPLTTGATYSGSLSALAAFDLYTYLEDPINDLVSHGTSMAAILIGDTLGIAKDATLTSFKVVTRSGVIEYAMKAAVKKVTATARFRNLLRQQKPMVIVTGVNFFYRYEDCVLDGWNCAVDLMAAIQTSIRWGVTFVTPGGNGYINARDYAFQPPGLTVPEPFPTGFDICHWARYALYVQPDADASYDGETAYFPQLLITGNEITGLTHIRPFRITGFNHNLEMVPTLSQASDSLGNTVLEINGFNYGSCIDYAVPGSEFERLAVLNKTVYGEMDPYGGAWGFTETDADYPGGITDWFPVDFPTWWESNGKVFPTGYKSAPYLSSGTSFSTPIAAATIMSTLIARWPLIKPTFASTSGFMKKVFANVEALNVAGTTTQYNFGYEASYTGLANLNSIWGEADPEQSTYPAKKNPTFKRLKMNKVNPTCV